MDHRRFGGPSGLPVPMYSLETPKPQSRLGKMRQSLGGHASIPMLQADRSMTNGAPQPNILQSVSRPNVPNMSVRRQSSRPSVLPNPLLASVQRQPLGSRTPVRQTAGMAFPNSTAPRPPIPRSQNMPDDRPLRDRGYQSSMLKAVNAFLREQGKDMALKGIAQPSVPEFRDIFFFIYNVVFEDDRQSSGGKVDEEVTELLRVVRYPWIDALSKLSFSVIVPHVWPQLLGVLHWMVQVYDFQTKWIAEKRDANLIEDMDGENADPGSAFDASHLHRTFMCYLGDVWLDYVSGKVDFSAQRADFMAIFDARMEEERQKLERDQETLAALRKEATELKKSEDAEKELKGDIVRLESEIDGLLELNRNVQNKTRERSRAHQDLLANIGSREDRLAELNKQASQLAEEIRQQNLSAEEVARMFRDRETLSKQLEDLKERDINLQQNVDDLTVSIFRKSDDVEKMVDDIMNLLYKVNLHPRPPRPFRAGEFHITFNRATDDPESLVAGPDISPGGDMIRKILSYTDEIRTERAALASEAVVLENELETTQNELDQLCSQVAEIREEVSAIQEELKLARDAWEDESRGSRTELEKMRREITRIKTANQDRGTELGMRLDTLRLKKKDTAAKLQRLKAKTISDIITKVEEVAQFKTWTSEQLEKLTRSAKEDDLKLLADPVNDLDDLVKRLSSQ